MPNTEHLETIQRLLAEAGRELQEIDAHRAKVLEQIEHLKQEQQALQILPGSENVDNLVTSQSPVEPKIALYRSLFRGRDDVYPRRFESRKTGRAGYAPVCNNEWVRGICGKPNIRCERCEQRDYAPVTDTVIKNHLSGFAPSEHSQRDFTIGVYPMLLDETCWFLAVDFDKADWQEDAAAFLETCRLHNVPAALERSRSGNGGHIWIFFSKPVSTFQARKMGAFLITQTMERRPELGLESYDRFFPSQDTLPSGGFGNLIALPLQKKPRERNNSVFLDAHFEPYADQWAFLTSIHRMESQELDRLVDKAEKSGDLLGVQLSTEDEANETPWLQPPSKRQQELPLTGPLPEKIELVLANQVFIPKEGLPPGLRNRLIRLAAFQNPEFYKAQAMRFSTFDKPRIISCCEVFSQHLALPRGCLDAVIDLLQSLTIEVAIKDERQQGKPIESAFQGLLKPEQQQAADALLQHETGTLSASTAFGKTVLATYLIAQRKTNTLVVVHRRQLLDQWIKALAKFLDLKSDHIGQIGGGKNKPTGLVDVAMVQSLVKKGVVDDRVADYGYVIVDECHHISAVSFEQVIRQCKARYVTGLSATVARKDGHHPIIFMQTGPVRYRVSDRKQAEERPFEHKFIVRQTEFDLPDYMKLEEQPPHISEIYDLLAADEARNQLIVSDVVQAIQDGRSPVLLSERREHLETFAHLLEPLVTHVVIMKGGMGKKQRMALSERLANIPRNEARVIIATGRYLGEGFDDPRLDTLFLALPISWRGTLAQYAGRLHRLDANKEDVLIYDYVDINVPMLTRMFARRRTGYRQMGYQLNSND